MGQNWDKRLIIQQLKKSLKQDWILWNYWQESKILSPNSVLKLYAQTNGIVAVVNNTESGITEFKSQLKQFLLTS